MDERRRHALSGQNRPGMEYDINLQLPREDMSYIDQILQRDRNEDFMDRTTQPTSVYGSQSVVSYFGNHGHQGLSYSNLQNQTRNPSYSPSMYIPQTYPNYPSCDQSRYGSGQTVGHLPYSGYERCGNAVVGTAPLRASQSLPSNRNTADVGQISWHNETNRIDVSSRQATTVESRNNPTSYGTSGSKTEVIPPQIPRDTLANNYSCNSEMYVNERSMKDPYNTAESRDSLPMNYEASHVTPRLDSNKSEASMPPTSTKKYSKDVHQSELEPPVNVPFPETTYNSIDGSFALPPLGQNDKDMSGISCKDHEHFQSADSHYNGQKTEETRSEHSSHSANDKLALSPTQDHVKTCDANCSEEKNVIEQNSLKTEGVVTGDDRIECTSFSQESLDHVQPAKIADAEQKNYLPADSEPGCGKTLGSENVPPASESKQNTKKEIVEGNVDRLPEFGSIGITSSDSPNPCNTCVGLDGAKQEFHIQDKSQQSKYLPKENCDDHIDVKEASISMNTRTTVRTTVDLSAAEQGCSTVVKFEDGTCKFIKGEPTSEKEEDAFYCSSQKDHDQVAPEPKKLSSEDSPTGIQEKDNVPIVKQEIHKEQQCLKVGDAIEEFQKKDEVKLEVKLEVEEGSGSSSELSKGVSDETRHGAVLLKAQDGIPVMGHLECNYDSDGWQVGSGKQDTDISSKINSAPGADDDGMFDRCHKCNELISSSDMIEHPFKCKGNSNSQDAQINIPINLQTPSDDEAALNCPECGVGFQTMDDLVIHLRIHEMLAKNARKMQNDNQMMVMTAEMEKHMTDFADITEETSEECHVCYETFTDPTMIPYHHMMHQQFPFHCRKCNLFFSTLTELHKSRCSDQKRHKVFKYRCKKCKGVLLDSYKMRKHRKRCEGKMETCRLCQKKFPSFKQLAQHAEICNEDQMKKDGEEGMDYDETDVVLEETVLKNEDADHEAADFGEVDQAAVDHGSIDHDGADQTAEDNTTANHNTVDNEIVDQNATHHGNGPDVKSDSRPAEADIREVRGEAETFAHGDAKMGPSENAIETHETSQPSVKDSSVVRCKVCERELPIFLRYHGRAYKEIPEYCKACMNMVRTKNLPPDDKSSASKNDLPHKRTLPTESSSSNEEMSETAGCEPSKKKHRKEQADGETCGACGRWFKNFDKLEKHAAKCDGVRKKHDAGACPEELANDEINLDWKYPAVHRCPKCNKKFVKEKKLQKHVKSCLWIQEGTDSKPSVDSSVLVDDAQSGHEDQLPLSTMKNVNGAFAEDSSDRGDVPDSVERTPGTCPMDTFQSSDESSRVEPMSGSAATLQKVDKGESNQNVGDISKKSAEDAREKVCVFNGRDVDKHHAESIKQIHEMEKSFKSTCDEGTENSIDPSRASSQQVASSEREAESSTSQHANAVPSQDEMVPSSTSLDTMPQNQLSQGNASGTLLEENMSPSSSSSENNTRKDVLSFIEPENRIETVNMDSVHSVPTGTENAKTGLSSSLASSLSAELNVKKSHHMGKESKSSCPEIIQEERAHLREQRKRSVCNKGGKDTESCPVEGGARKSAEPEQVLETVDKSLPVVSEASEPLPGQLTDDEDTRGSMSWLSSSSQGDHVAQARSTSAPTHQETVSFQDETTKANQVSVLAMSGIEGKSHFSGLKEESSMDSSLEVEYAMSLEAVKTISLECKAILGHHCVYCAAEFPSRNDLWKHARDCRDNHLMVIANRGKYQLVEKPVSCGNVPWQVLNDYTKKEAMVMKMDMGIDLNCVVPAVGYRPPPNKPEPEPVKNKKRKKKKKSKVKEDIEKEKKRKIERKKRKDRERQREKLRVQAKLQQLEQNNMKKLKAKEQQKTFTCELCNRSFHSREKFEKHKVSHVFTPHKKTLAVCVEKLKVEDIEDQKKSKSTTEHSGNSKLKGKESSKKKNSKVPENQSVTKKKTTKKKSHGKEESKQVYVDVESIEGSDTNIAEGHRKKNPSTETSQSVPKPSDSVPTIGPLSTASRSVEGIQQADTGSSQVKSKGTTWKKNEFGVQFPVVIEVECPDCQMKFSHQSTLDRHRRLHRK